MILRDAQLSDRRSSWPAQGSTAVQRTPERAPEQRVTAAQASVTPLPVPPAPEAPAKPQAPPIVEKKEPVLTFEAVVSWLAVQNAETRKDCAAILAGEVARLYESAKADGFAAGEKAAQASLKEQASHTLLLLEQITSNAQVAFDRELETLERICVEVVGEALAKIAGPLLNSKQAVVGGVREILLRVKEGRELTIRVAPQDYELLRNHEKELSDALVGRKYDFMSDPRVELGGCIVETKSGSLDGRLEVQLRELYETLRMAKSSSMELG